MIKVKKDFVDIPKILKRQNRKNAFDRNISLGQYVDEKNLYKVGSVQKILKNIYNLKCAYCEQKLLDAPKHIEHYRPKDIYYWLAYSWDNLLLSCGSCNSSKGINFQIKKTIVNYTSELFEDIHNLGSSYDVIEEPMIINPEKEDVLDKLVFDKEGNISSSDDRVIYTINEVCNLNREELVQKRVKLLNDFINKINEHYLLFLKKGDITRFIPEIKFFIDECSVENEFYSFRFFILNHIELFFEDTVKQKILKALIDKITAKSL
ncbi:retron system putative HNH endonuclease [Aliarcobacter skirrowii]|uniref:retron system putative HNH endonuclease n=1 Tax=Aliarcobacter skirrowii TaxID=28200 RepID=UPI0029BE9EEE|nr:retron system putative HNH endonuclease [Aliarcobacter skirrowii]MDX4066804.1 retron system putative HNH endonuclease [Aliarcobacter skirrowii]